MTLVDIYKLIEFISYKQPNVHQFVDEFDSLNRENTQYSAIVCQQREHIWMDDRVTYNFYIGYVDRLNETKNNKIQIHSTGILLINNILQALKSNLDIDNATIGTIITVTQKFTAECACAYAALSITVPLLPCEIDYNVDLKPQKI